METRLRHCAPGLSPRRALGPNAARLRRVGTARGCSGKAPAATGRHRRQPHTPRAPTATLTPSALAPGPLMLPWGCGGRNGPEPRPGQHPAGLQQPKG